MADWRGYRHVDRRCENVGTPYIQRWSLDVQRELGKAVVATLGYVGSEGTHLPIQYDLNLYPQGFYPDIYTSNVSLVMRHDR